MEAYTAADTASKFKWHLGLLAMNAEGYQNLMKITTQAWEDFYYEPTVLGKTLSGNKSGLAVLSGCTGSKLACDLVGGKGTEEHIASPDIRRASETAARFRDIFGSAYYLEVQAFPELDKTCAINPAYERIGAELGIPLVATCDVHYCFPEESDCQVVLHANGRGSKTFEQQSLTWEYDVPMTFPQSDDALWKRLKETGLSRKASSEAIHNAGALAERCNVTLPRAARLRYPGREAEMKWPENISHG
jgi:DNA polymerase III subunit alpha